ncbi:MAG: phosphoribosyltransferase family protein, partial [Pelagibacteraceae bacterium]
MFFYCFCCKLGVVAKIICAFNFFIKRYPISFTHLQYLQKVLIDSMANKLIIDWKQYNLIVEKLAVKIHESGFKPTMLIGIMRGGAPIIDVLSRIFKLKCAYLA